MSIPQKTYFCAMPWLGLSVSPNGWAHPCCLITHTSFGDLITDDLKTVYNSEMFKTIRLNMMNDVYPTQCDICLKGEKLNGYTLRKTKNNLLAKYVDEALANTDKTTGELSKITIMDTDIRFSNVCNFQCKMCCGRFSSRHNKGKVTPHSTTIFEKTKECFDTVKYCYFAGGEPFLMKETYDTIELLKKRKDFSEIEFGFSTNLSVLKFNNNDVIEVLKGLKKCVVNCSLDGLGEVGEKIRVGSNFEVFKSNIMRVRKETNVGLNVHCVVSRDNVMEIPELIEWVESFKYYNGMLEKNVIGNFSCNFVGGKKDMCIKGMSAEEKRLVNDKYEKWMVGKNGKGCDKLKNIMRYMGK